MGKNSAVGNDLIVEKIVGRRFNPTTGFLEYRIKWLNYSEKENTWERAGNIHSLSLIHDYEASRNEAAPQVEQDPNERPKATFGLLGLTLGWEPEAVLGIERKKQKEKSDHFFYILKYKNRPEGEFVDNEVASIAFPHLVIEFLEKSVVFTTPST